MVRKIVRKLKDFVVYHANIIGLSVAILFLTLSIYFDLHETLGKPLFVLILLLVLIAVIAYMYIMMQVRLVVRSKKVMENFMEMDLTPFYDNEPDTFYSMGEEWNKDA